MDNWIYTEQQNKIAMATYVSLYNRYAYSPSDYRRETKRNICKGVRKILLKNYRKREVHLKETVKILNEYKLIYLNYGSNPSGVFFISLHNYKGKLYYSLQSQRFPRRFPYDPMFSLEFRMLEVDINNLAQRKIICTALGKDSWSKVEELIKSTVHGQTILGG